MADDPQRWILDPDHYPDGPTVARVLVRPLRFAYLVPEHDVGLFGLIAASCHALWGGWANFFVPYSAAVGIADAWARVVALLDPDFVVDCVGARDAELAKISGSARRIHRWADPRTEPFPLASTSQYSALNAYGGSLRPGESRTVVVVPSVAADHPLFLPIISRFGVLPDGLAREPVPYGWAGRPQLSTFVRIESVTVPADARDIVLGDHLDLDPERLGSGSWEFPSLLQLTRLGLRPESPSYGIGAEPADETRQFDGSFSNRVVVTGEARSVADASLFWAIRASRDPSAGGPVFLPIELLATEEGVRAARRILSFSAPTLDEDRHKPRRTYVASATMSPAELEHRLSPLMPEARIDVERFDWYVRAPVRLHAAQTSVPTSLARGRTAVSMDRPAGFERFGYLDRVAFEIGFENARLPTVPRGSPSACDNFTRVTAAGTLQGANTAGLWNGLVKVYLPSTWELFRSLCEEQGYVCSRGEKGRTAVGQLVQFGAIDGLRLLSSSLVYESLRDLSVPRRSGEPGRERQYFAERKTVTLQWFERAWGRDTAKLLVPWLVARGLLLRGTDITCRVCRLARWYSLDRLTDEWRCDGCRTLQPIPLRPDNAPWRYRINELFAHGHDQGTVAQLLALWSVYYPRAWSDGVLLGLYPGVDLTAAEGATVPVGAIDLDMVAIEDRALTIVECKETGEGLTREQAEDLVAVANQLSAGRLVFMTTRTFGPARAIIDAATAGSAVPVEVWEQADVFDVIGRYDGDVEEMRPDPATWPATYLQELASTLTGDSPV